MLSVTTPSTVPPSFTVTAVGNYTEGSAVLTVATNASANVNYLVMLGEDTAVPSVAQVSAHPVPSVQHDTLTMSVCYGVYMYVSCMCVCLC